MAQAVSDLAAAAECGAVVDIGSGVGHLSRMAAYSKGLRVSCVDAEQGRKGVGRQTDI